MPVNSHMVSISRRNMIIAIVVFLAMDVFAFFMGITVGRYGRKYQEQVPVQEVVQSPPVTVATSELDSDLAAFEEKDSKERETPVEVDFLDEETLVADQEEVAPEPAVATPKVPTEAVPETEPKTDPGVPDVSVLEEGFWIQVLAIGELNSAQRFKQRIVGGGYQAKIIAEDGLYKVQVGPYEERALANEARQQLNTRFDVEGWIRKR